MPHYTYWLTCNETGQHYIGKRTSSNVPEEDDYMSSSKVVHEMLSNGRTFSKYILAIWDTSEEAMSHEILLHDIFSVDKNPNFLNMCKQTSSKFVMTSKVASMIQQKKVKDGTHHMLGGEIQRKRLQDGKHNFLDPEYYVKIQEKMLKEGTHNMIGGKIQSAMNRRLVVEGRHCFQHQKYYKDSETGRIGRRCDFSRWRPDRLPFLVPLD